MSVRLKELGADFALLAVAFVWGATFLIVQDAVNATPVYTFLFWRFFVAAVLMCAFSYKHLLQLDKRTFLMGAALGTFLFLGYAFQTFGLIYTFSSTVGFITGLNVVFIPFLLYFVFKQRIGFYSVLGSILAACGLYLLSSNVDIGIGRGEFFAFICALMFAFHIVFTGFFARKSNIFALVSVQFLTVAFLSLIGIFALKNPIAPPSFDALFIKAVIITAVFATVFAFFVQTAMQRFTSAVKAAIIFMFEPVTAGFVGYFFANELLSGAQLLGAVLILAGMMSAEIGSQAAKFFKKFLPSREKNMADTKTERSDENDRGS